MNLCECTVLHFFRGTVYGFLSVCGWTTSSLYWVLIVRPEQNLKESYLASSASVFGTELAEFSGIGFKILCTSKVLGSVR